MFGDETPKNETPKHDPELLHRILSQGLADRQAREEQAAAMDDLAQQLGRYCATLEANGFTRSEAVYLCEAYQAQMLSIVALRWAS